eukprot:12422210-Karenia_brevis.AAC.1
MYSQQGFKCVSVGYPQGGNPKTGVQICINTKKIPENMIHSFAFPQGDQDIQGRLLVVRERGAQADIAHFCCYFPSASTPKWVSITKKKLKWMAQVLDKMPTR